MTHILPATDAYRFDARQDDPSPLSSNGGLISIREQRARLANTLARLDAALAEMAAELEGGIA